MKRLGLSRLHRDEPPALTTCLAVSAVCSVALFVFLLAFFPISMNAPGAQPLLFVVFFISFIGTMIWRFHRYGFYMTKSQIRRVAGPDPDRFRLRRKKSVKAQPALKKAKQVSRLIQKAPERSGQVRPVRKKAKTFFQFNLAHLVLIILAVGLTGTVLFQGTFVDILRSLPGDSGQASAFRSGWRASTGLFAEKPVFSMILLGGSLAIGLLFSSHIARTGEERGWSTRTVNILVALMACLMLPACLLSGVSLVENLVVGLGLLTCAAWGTVLVWKFTCDALGGKPAERRRRLVRRKVKRSGRGGVTVEAKSGASHYKPKFTCVRVPHLGQCSPYHRRSILLP